MGMGWCEVAPRRAGFISYLCKWCNVCTFLIPHPGIPPDSSLLAMSTSQDQTSNCHFLRPNTPHSTEPEWIPIRMSMSCFVRERTYLQEAQQAEFRFQKADLCKYVFSATEPKVPRRVKKVLIGHHAPIFTNHNQVHNDR